MTLSNLLLVGGMLINVVASGTIFWITYRGMGHGKRPHPSRLLLAITAISFVGVAIAVFGLTLTP